MSIKNEIERLSQAKLNLKIAIEGKGIEVPSNATLNAFASFVEQISGGSSGGGWDVAVQHVSGLEPDTKAYNLDVDTEFASGSVNFTYPMVFGSRTVNSAEEMSQLVNSDTFLIAVKQSNPQFYIGLQKNLSSNAASIMSGNIIGRSLYGNFQSTFPDFDIYFFANFVN